MNEKEKEIEKFIKDLKKLTEQMSTDKEKSFILLKNAGIINQKGQLIPHYR